MNRIFYTGLLVLPFLYAGNIFAQDSGAGDVKINSDSRLAILVRKNHSYVRLTVPAPAKAPELLPKTPAYDTYVGSSGLVHHETKTNYTGKGYRVQIYNGPSREKALATKTEFMRRYPGVRTYFNYIAPAFRVKIGDFRSHNDAEGMLREANSLFSPSMIVPDIVTISAY